MAKKAQAALEFLMTYGWAILVVLVVIGTLAYFGVLNPQVLLPEKCTLQMGLYCKDHLITGAAADLGTVDLELENGIGKDITIVGGAGTSVITGTELGTCTLAGDIPIDNGDQQTVTFGTCTAVTSDSAGKKVKGDISIDWYYTDSGDTYTHTMEGEILARVE